MKQKLATDERKPATGRVTRTERRHGSMRICAVCEALFSATQISECQGNRAKQGSPRLSRPDRRPYDQIVHHHLRSPACWSELQSPVEAASRVRLRAARLEIRSAIQRTGRSRLCVAPLDISRGT